MQAGTISIAMAGLDPDFIDLVDCFPMHRIAGVIGPDRPEGDVLPYLGRDEDWNDIKAAHPGLRIVLGIDSPAIRRRVVANYFSEDLIGLVSPFAEISRSAVVGEATIIQRGVVLMPLVSIG